MRRGSGERFGLRPLLLPLVLAAGGVLHDWLDREVRAALAAAAPERPAGPEFGLPAFRLTAGFQAALADWYWIRTLTYFGRQARTQVVLDVSRMPELPGLLWRTVTLDPRHLAAWRFGAFFLSQAETEEGLRFVRAGIRENPREWRLRADLAFICWQAGRHREAALAWQQAAALPGAPAWIEPMAAITLKEGGEIATARAVFRRLIESSTDPFVREVSLLQLERLERTELLPRESHPRGR